MNIIYYYHSSLITWNPHNYIHQLINIFINVDSPTSPNLVGYRLADPTTGGRRFPPILVGIAHHCFYSDAEDKTMISEALNKGRKALYEVIRMKRQIGQIGWRSFSI